MRIREDENVSARLPPSEISRLGYTVAPHAMQQRATLPPPSQVIRGPVGRAIVNHQDFGVVRQRVFQILNGAPQEPPLIAADYHNTDLHVSHGRLLRTSFLLQPDVAGQFRIIESGFRPKSLSAEAS